MVGRNRSTRPCEARETPGRVGQVRALLLAVLAALVAYLALGPKPWTAGVAASLASGHDLKVADYVVTGSWWAALTNGALVGLLLATLPLWCTGGPPPERRAFRGPARPSRPAFLAGVLGAVAVLAVLAAPRLDQSLWDDELQNVIRSIDGHYRRDETGEVSLRTTTWTETLWYYRQPNNHVPHTILARLATQAWRAWTGSEERRFSEPVLRMPAFTGGLAAVFALAWLLRRIGHPGAGALAAWVFALHPWMLRYTSEARGYALALLLLSVVVVLLWRSLESGSWKRWLAWGAVQLLLLWMNPGVLAWLAVLNLGALGLLWHVYRGTSELRPQLARWGVACLLGAAVFLQLTAPLWPQVLEFSEWLSTLHPLRARWHADVGSYLLAGMPWHQPSALGPDYPRLEDVAARWGPGFWVALAAAIAGVIAGAVRLSRRGPPGIALAALFLLPGVVTWAIATLSQSFIWPWYLVFALPGAIALFALGATWTASLQPRPLGVAVAALVTLAALGGEWALGADARRVLRERSFQPMRESVALTRPLHSADTERQERILTTSFGRRPELYDPFHRPMRRARASVLRKLMEEARSSGRPLFVNGTPLKLEKHDPELHRLLAEEFDRVALLHGFEPRLARAVYRYRGTAADEAVASTAEPTREATR